MKKVLKVTFILTGENSGHTGNFGSYEFKDGKYQIITRDPQALASAINILRHYAAFPSDFVRLDPATNQYNLVAANPDDISDKLIDEQTGVIQQIPIVAGHSQPDPDPDDNKVSGDPDDDAAAAGDGSGDPDDDAAGDGSADNKKSKSKKK